MAAEALWTGKWQPIRLHKQPSKELFDHERGWHQARTDQWSEEIPELHRVKPQQQHRREFFLDEERTEYRSCGIGTADATEHGDQRQEHRLVKHGFPEGEEDQRRSSIHEAW